MSELAQAQLRAMATYDAAADSYCDAANDYWDRYGRRTIERLTLPRGGSVLDVACGAGASAIPAAQAVGFGGRVIAVDLSERLLDLARSKAAERSLRQIEFRQADFNSLDLPADSFDAVVSVFGVFFAPAMEELVADLWRLLRPGGRLAITTWGAELFEPMYSAFDTAVGALRPDLVSDYRPWDRLTRPAAVAELLTAAGATNVEVCTERGEQDLVSARDWWSIVMGSGLRAVVEALGPESAFIVRQHNLDFVARHDIRSVTANVIYGTAEKPGDGLPGPGTNGVAS